MARFAAPEALWSPHKRDGAALELRTAAPGVRAPGPGRDGRTRPRHRGADVDRPGPSAPPAHPPRGQGCTPAAATPEPGTDLPETGAPGADPGGLPRRPGGAGLDPVAASHYRRRLCPTRGRELPAHLLDRHRPDDRQRADPLRYPGHPARGRRAEWRGSDGARPLERRRCGGRGPSRTGQAGRRRRLTAAAIAVDTATPRRTPKG